MIEQQRDLSSNLEMIILTHCGTSQDRIPGRITKDA